VRYVRVDRVAAASAEELAAFAGTYHSDELGVDYVVRRRGESLTLEAGGAGRIPVEFGGPVVALTRNGPALFGDPGFITVRFTRGRGRVDGFRLDFGPYLAGIRFERR
jgi:hypothetical protein